MARILESAVLAPASIVTGALIFAALVWVVIISLGERERRAAALAFSLALILPLPYLLVGLTSFAARGPVAGALLAVTVVALGVLLVPIGGGVAGGDDTPTTRIDERDVMFSRAELEPGTALYAEYYAANPEKKAVDDAFRALPGLLGHEATMYNPYAFAAAESSFATVKHLRSVVDGAVADERIECDAGEVTGFIKSWSLKLGAVTVGAAELRDYHVYTHVGRGAEYGRQVEREHEYAIAFTVEMAKEMMDAAPKSTIVMESSQQYMAAGAIAVQIAAFIRGLGYPARAHIDGNYRVVCPLVARDAGLGEIGRMGLLMTPELGPRVRLGVVTTNLPLVIDGRKPDRTMVDFCTKCRKCAVACPSKAISFEGRATIDGVRRWRIDQEACYTLWTKLGTDCGRCVSVCPYSHPNNSLHNLVRAGVRNSALFRRLAIVLDDVFYGRTPASADLPDWLEAESATGPAGAAGIEGQR